MSEEKQRENMHLESEMCVCVVLNCSLLSGACGSRVSDSREGRLQR